MNDIIKNVKKCIKESSDSNHHIISTIMKYSTNDIINSLPYKLANKYILGTINNNNNTYIQSLKMEYESNKMNEIYNKENRNNDKIEFKPGYNFLYEYFRNWINKLIKLIKQHEKELSYISMSLYENQGIGLETISKVIFELMVITDEKLLSKNLSEIDDILDVIKKVYIMKDELNYATETSMINLISWFNDDRILTHLVTKDNYELGKISNIIWDKYVDIIYKLYNMHDKTIKNNYFTQKLKIKYGFSDSRSNYIYTRIDAINSILNKTNKNTLLLIKFMHMNIMSFLIELKIIYDNYNEIRGIIYILYYYLTTLLSMYFTFDLDDTIDEKHKNKLVKILNHDVVPFKRKLNNQWSTNNSKKHDELYAIKNKYACKNETYLPEIVL